MKYLKYIFFINFLLLLSCGGGGGDGAADSSTPEVPTRSFYMGFTPWPYDSTLNAVNITYQKIQQHGDIVHHQIMQGIPWDEAFNSTAYPLHLENDLSGRLNQTLTGKTILLSIDSLDASRTVLASNWGENGSELRAAPWDTRNFDSPEVITAYTNFALDLIDRFNPEYFNYGTEASELILSDLDQYNRFKVFAQQVYTNIKAQYPDLKLMFSIALKHPTSAEMDLISQNLTDILPYVDVLGVSVYPYIFYNHADKGDPANLPSDWLDQVTQLAPGKAIAITETGWIAEDLVIDVFGVNVASNEMNQRNYVVRLLEESNQLNIEFVIWWSVIDFQALWDDALGQDDLAAIWRDIGLYDEMVQPRSGLADWQLYLDRPKR
ncbi:hypothetical protein MNBD_GAMMA21-2567 [hydrothermal vent metagenome]|uniref:Arabinogalactan endo-beta-1,4-galactanase n=1 Tax=hydrothermal vent metagenome TaxID=652676 RepID=A0A3B0ZT68_9ZZZZ